MDEVIQDYHIEIKIKNGRILELMRRAGIPTAYKLSKLTGVHPTELGKIINLKMSALSDATGDYLQVVYKMAAALNCSPDDMFTDHQRASFMETNKVVIKRSEAEIDFLASRLEARNIPPDELIEAEERNAALHALMNSVLTPKERDILTYRFGLDGVEETLNEVGKRFSVGAERIRQIETKAIRHLKVKLQKAGADALFCCRRQKVRHKGALESRRRDIPTIPLPPISPAERLVIAMRERIRGRSSSVEVVDLADLIPTDEPVYTVVRFMSAIGFNVSPSHQIAIPPGDYVVPKSAVKNLSRKEVTILHGG